MRNSLESVAQKVRNTDFENIAAKFLLETILSPDFIQSLAEQEDDIHSDPEQHGSGPSVGSDVSDSDDSDPFDTDDFDSDVDGEPQASSSESEDDSENPQAFRI